MGEQTPLPGEAAPAGRERQESKRQQRRSLMERLRSNPGLLKELRGRMRGVRSFLVLTGYLLLMSGLVVMGYLAYASTADLSTASQGGSIGKIVFGSIVAVELFMVCFVAPSFTAGAISGEHERQTYDLLRTTLLPARSLVLGKLYSALSYVVLLLLVSVPLQSMAFMLGGVTMAAVLISLVILFTTALAFGAIGLFFSSLTRRTLSASVLTYVSALALTLGLPLLSLIMLPVLAILLDTINAAWVEAALIYGSGLLSATNPVITATLTEVVLLKEQSALYFTVNLSNGFPLPLISPWIIMAGFYIFLALIFIELTIMRVHKVDG